MEVRCVADAGRILLQETALPGEEQLKAATFGHIITMARDTPTLTSALVGRRQDGNGILEHLKASKHTK